MTITKKQPKPCKKCSTKRYANLTLCYKHYRAREKEKRVEREARKLARKKKTKKYQEKTRKSLHKKCWKLMSNKIRLTGADSRGFNTCYTCGKMVRGRELHAGHFHHNKLDFDERNLRPQCNACNTYQGGKPREYSLKLVKENSIEWLERLKHDADNHPGYRYDDLLNIYEKLSQEANNRI